MEGMSQPSGGAGGDDSADEHAADGGGSQSGSSTDDANEATATDYTATDSYHQRSAQQEKRRAAPSPDYDDPNLLPSEGAGPATADRIAEFRREKRLAMNRESARNRRKRKKMLIETLEQQNTDLSRENRSLKLIRDTLTAKTRALENELAAARATIAQFQLASATHLPNQGFGTSALPSASRTLPLSLSGPSFASQFNTTDHQNIRNSDHPDPIGQNITNPIDPFGLASRSLHQTAQFPSAGTRNHPHLADDAILRQHALDIQALSQASRDSALGSISNPQHLLGDSSFHRGIGLQTTLPNMRSDAGHVQPQPPNPFLGFSDLPITQNVRLPDTWLQSQMSLRGDDVNSSQQRMLEELLRQRDSGDSGDPSKKLPKFPPSES